MLNPSDSLFPHSGDEQLDAATPTRTAERAHWLAAHEVLHF